MNTLIDNGIQTHTIDTILIDSGPEIKDDTLQTSPDFEKVFIESDLIEPMQIDRIGKLISVDSPTVNPIPINEFGSDGLASFCFTSLFQNGNGDPTKKSRQIEVSETDGFKHLLKYATLNTHTKELYYPFA